MSEPVVSQKDALRVFQRMLSPEIKEDLFAWVMYAFPWGVKGTPLEYRTGPNSWQKAELDRITAHIRKNKELVEMGMPPVVYQSAVSSGRGVGKSTFVAWVTLWFMSTVLGGTSIISANNDTQLSSKTFGEINKWKTMCLSGFWFETTQKKITPAPWFAEQVKKHKAIDERLYYTEGVLWNEDNPDAFAGAHNTVGLLLIFDEASGIPAPVWKVSEGFFTDLSIYRFWLAFSNPRRNTGSFFECFHKFREYWHTRKVDARKVEDLDQKIYQDIIKKYGEDSDQAKVEVMGEFPSAGDSQFIGRHLVMAAQIRELERMDDHAALVMGVDPARFGSDSTVIRFRRGRDARSIPPVILKRVDNMVVANKVAELIEQFNPDAVFVDAGAGSGVIDRLREMGYKVHEVGFGTASTAPEWADHRTELWAKLRDWLEGAMIDRDEKLQDDLCGPEYKFAGVEDKIKLESKDDMKKRGLSSPDHADALALTFHKKIARSDLTVSRSGARASVKFAKGRDYKIFGGS